MLVSRFLNEVYATERGITKATRYQYAHSVALLEKWTGKPVDTRDLNPRMVVEWLDWLATKYAPATVADNRRNLLALWRYAAARGLCQLPGQIRPVRVPRPIPQAWTLPELARLLEVADRDLQLLLAVGYQTGLRRSDLMNLLRGSPQVAPDGTCRIVQSKTSQGHVCRLDAATAALLRLRGSVRIPLRSLYRRLRKLCADAGVKPGALQMLRRTGATAVERTQPGAASRYLGHRTPDLAARYYVDWAQVQEAVVPPPIHQT